MSGLKIHILNGGDMLEETVEGRMRNFRTPCVSMLESRWQASHFSGWKDVLGDSGDSDNERASLRSL